ncbi:MAG: MotA/TolQ/ExbB proton channel family protein [bacterium]
MNLEITAEHWFKQGGLVMYILSIFSIVVIAITLEKVFFLAKIGKKLDELKKAVNDNNFDERDELNSDPLYALYRSLSEIKANSKSVKEGLRLLDRAVQRFETRLNRGIGWLATIGNTAPFVGLLGTVLGIIRSFSALSKADPAGYGELSSGIAEALIATASGLIVAVPAVILYNFLVRRIVNTMVNVRLDAEDFLENIMNN